MAVKKDRIIVGNTYSVAYECVEPPADGVGDDLPLTPTSAYVELWSVETEQYIPLGTVGPNGVGAAATVVGNIVSYTVPSTKTTVAGDYKLYVTAIFSGSRVVTELRDFRVQDIT